MSDFSQAVKYLDLDRASKDETLNLKPLTLNKARALKKVQDYLTIPAHFYAAADVPDNYPGRMLFQYNVSVGYNFSFSIQPFASPFVEVGAAAGSLFIKYRVNDTVFRYRLPVGGAILTTIQFGQPSIQYLNWNGYNNNYVNQIIGANFCIEFWVARIDFDPFIGLLNDITFKLSRLRNPLDADDVGVTTGNVGPALELVDLGVNLPEALPYNQANIAWLNNVI